MFERFTPEARAVVLRAQQEALDLHQRPVGTEHLLLGLIEAPGTTGDVLRESGVEAADVRREIVRLVSQPPPILDEADAEALRGVGIDVDAVLARIEESFGPEALVAPGSARRGRFGRRRARGQFSPRAKKVLGNSLREAIRLQEKEIAARHILLGLMRENGGLGAQILAAAGVDFDALRGRIEKGRPRAA
jgi:ATP-dependent Clp protease ATP-binding subunit ClpA